MSDRVREDVDQGMRSHEEMAAELLDRADAGEEDAWQELMEWPLEARPERHLVLVLGTGGPHHQLDATLDDAGDIVSAEFFSIWGSHQRTTPVREGDALWRFAEMHAELLGP